MRCIARYRTGRLHAAQEDLTWLRGKELFGIGSEELERLSTTIETELSDHPQ
jgi:hypothetical protein